MTTPKDDLEKALREALSAAVNQVEPAADGLDRIRVRTSRRPPQPWPLSIVSAVIGRARNYVWRGHWAWREKAATLLTRPCRSSWHQFPTAVTILVGIVFIACLGLAVPPFREAIVQVGSTVLTGGGNEGTNGRGGTTNGNGTLSGDQGSHDGDGTGKGSSPSPSAAGQQKCKFSASGGAVGTVGAAGSAVTGTAVITLASPTQGTGSGTGTLPTPIPSLTHPAAHCSVPPSATVPTSSTMASPPPRTSPSGAASASSLASASSSPSSPASSSPAASATDGTPPATATAPPTNSGTTPPTTSLIGGDIAVGSGILGTPLPATAPAQ